MIDWDNGHFCFIFLFKISIMIFFCCFLVKNFPTEIPSLFFNSLMWYGMKCVSIIRRQYTQLIYKFYWIYLHKQFAAMCYVTARTPFFDQIWRLFCSQWYYIFDHIEKFLRKCTNLNICKTFYTLFCTKKLARHNLFARFIVSVNSIIVLNATFSWIIAGHK